MHAGLRRRGHPCPHRPSCCCRPARAPADLDKGSIIATASLFMELKFIRGCAKCGHIEDVVVDSSYRGLRLGLRVIEALMAAAQVRRGRGAGAQRSGWQGVGWLRVGAALAAAAAAREGWTHCRRLALAASLHMMMHAGRRCALPPPQEAGCYKVILDCSEANVPFYEKCGLERKEVQMVK